jgi:protein-S-isoprenylcysteine O-methyltransferase Ste14
LLIKGFDKFRAKVPAFSGKKVILLPIFMIFMASLAFLVYFTFDAFPNLFAASGIIASLLSFFPLFGVVIIEIAGFMLVWQMWLWKDKMKEKYGRKSYQRMFLIGFGGVTWVLTVAINQFIPYYSFAPTFWASSPLQVLATPIETFLGNAGPLIFYLKDVLMVFLSIIGLLMCTRAIQVFGFDYMVVLYLYFPEESKVQENEIYSVLRHPVYAGAFLIALCGAFLTFTFLSFVTYVLLLVGFYLHVHFVEEKELIQRFGDSYRTYRQKVPAFFINPNDLRAFLHFLFGKKANNHKHSRQNDVLVA